MSLRRRFVPGAAETMAARGLESFGRAVDLARVHDYCVKIETPEDHARTEAAMDAVAREVRARFADRSAPAARLTHFEAGAADGP